MRITLLVLSALLAFAVIGCEEELAHETQVRERGDGLVVEETTVTRDADGAIRTEKETTVIDR
jgi:hypothetical protein